ncbi:hypothetical protein [Kangiella sp. TOML190]|uniref:hypothetical protein n=1 Tax=Kangiella sp. TOML190 TaxID=2931351 RepID=UPI00203D4C75|nr:hypothetical protein [Kangiella sp. TOML190]
MRPSLFIIFLMNTANVTYQIPHSKLEVKYPENIALEIKNPIEDFSLLFFKNEGTDILSLYVGNHPLLSYKEDEYKKVRIINKLSHRCLKVRDFINECFIELGTEFPRFVHYSYKNSKDVSYLAEIIISSLKLTDK